VTVLSARCSARARPITARVHHRPPGARPSHDHDPDPAARKADELDWRAQPAASHRTYLPAVDVEPGADPPTTPWLPQPDSQRPPGERRGSVTRGRCAPAVPTSGRPETGWPPIPWPGLEWHSSAAQPSTRLRLRRPVRRHDHVEEVEFQPAAHRGLPANASMSALLTLAGDEAQKHGPGAGTLLLSGWEARVGYERDETIGCRPFRA